MEKWLTPLMAAVILSFGGLYYADWWPGSRAPGATADARFDPFTSAAASRHRTCQCTSWRDLLMR